MGRVLPYNAKQWEIPLLLDGRRTAARRPVKNCNIRDDQEINKNLQGQFELYNIIPRCGIPQGIVFKPPYHPGSILYVRETYKRNMDGYSGIDFGGYIYKADCPSGFKDLYNPWLPSIHMPKEVARIWLRCTDVRVERLQEIDEGGAKKEGHVNDICIQDGTGKSAAKHFAELWNSTLKKSNLSRYGWDANPWVWVTEFERCEKPEREV